MQLLAVLVMLSVMTALNDNAIDTLGVSPDEARARIKAWALLNLRLTAHLESYRALAERLRPVLARNPVPRPVAPNGWAFGEHLDAQIAVLDERFAAFDVAAKVVLAQASRLHEGFVLDRRTSERPLVAAVHAYAFAILFLWRAGGWSDPEPPDLAPGPADRARLIADHALSDVRERSRWRNALTHCKSNVQFSLDQLPPIEHEAPFSVAFAPEGIMLLAEAQRLRRARPSEEPDRAHVTPRQLLDYILSARER